MEQVGLIFRLIHFLGLAILMCGILCQLTVKIRTVNWEMMAGATTQFVSGLILVGLRWPDVNLLRAGVKLALLLIILAFLLIYRKKELSKLLYSTILILALADIVLAVFWQ
ncbi:hypothetical protein AMJ44_03575 [candidate division WOR-1 bacterium DG_54_3]|uniref:Uncharacterized protein n=1 Tax=candidate division WOR-1 bacterium DG_54_3 TaxID=1703775 RepID=A0A0S7Y4C2_UNCSA|nr:MAG: hypothetical protein AMJ44_03575 [candidate division WOR-1 bacterium DG_54_3]